MFLIPPKTNARISFIKLYILLLNKSRKRLPSIFRKRSDKLKRDLEDAVREPNSPLYSPHRNSLSPSQLSDEDAISANELLAEGGDFYEGRMVGGSDAEMYTVGAKSLKNAQYYAATGIPTAILMKFDAHENESHAVRWCPVDRLVATGGADRKVKLWDISKGKQNTINVMDSPSSLILKKALKRR